MKPHSDADIRARARHAYERARAGNALALGAIVALPALAVSLRCCPSPAASALCGTVLGFAVAGARFMGQGSQAGLRSGLMAGAIAFALPVVCRVWLVCPSGVCASSFVGWLPAIALGGAFVGGLMMRAAPSARSRLVAVSTALLLGSLGSLAAGLEGPLWTAAGLALGRILPGLGLARNS